MTESEKKSARVQYQASMSVFKGWYDNGVLSLDDLCSIDKRLTEKYGLTPSSIYRPQDLIFPPKRVINVMLEGGRNSNDDENSEAAD